MELRPLTSTSGVSFFLNTLLGGKMVADHPDTGHEDSAAAALEAFADSAAIDNAVPAQLADEDQDNVFAQGPGRVPQNNASRMYMRPDRIPITPAANPATSGTHVHYSSPPPEDYGMQRKMDMVQHDEMVDVQGVDGSPVRSPSGKERGKDGRPRRPPSPRSARLLAQPVAEKNKIRQSRILDEAKTLAELKQVEEIMRSSAGGGLNGEGGHAIPPGFRPRRGGRPKAEDYDAEGNLLPLWISPDLQKKRYSMAEARRVKASEYMRAPGEPTLRRQNCFANAHLVATRALRRVSSARRTTGDEDTFEQRGACFSDAQPC